MASVYIIHFIETGEESAYTTITALCNAYDREELNVSRTHLNLVLKEHNIFKNKKIIVKKYKPLTNSEVLKLK